LRSTVVQEEEEGEVRRVEEREETLHLVASLRHLQLAHHTPFTSPIQWYALIK
jgi:hypothetical protein